MRLSPFLGNNCKYNTCKMLTPYQYESLGREVFKKYPGLAKDIIKERNIHPDLKDFSLLPEALRFYCDFKSITARDVSRTSKLKIGFCALCLMLFQSDSLKDQKLRLKYGLRIEIERVLTYSSNRVRCHDSILKARFYFEQYKDFRSEIETAYSTIAPKLCC